MPERSALPSAVLGAAAARFGAPEAVFGTPVDGYFTHCARTGEGDIRSRATRNVRTIMRRKFYRRCPDVGRTCQGGWFDRRVWRDEHGVLLLGRNHDHIPARFATYLRQ